MPEIPLIMPKMSMTMSEGEVIGWRKQAGDPVSAGEVICEVLTDKVDMEVESPVDGILDRIVATANATVPVGEPLAFIRTDSEALLDDLLTPPTTPNAATAAGPTDTAAAAEGRDTAAAAGPADAAGAAGGRDAAAAAEGRDAVDAAGPADTAAAARPTDIAAAGGRGAAAAARPATRAAGGVLAGGVDPADQVGGGEYGGVGAARATPPSRRGPIPALPGARRRAGELGVRLEALTGTGPSGAISLADVERAAARPAPADAGQYVSVAPASTSTPVGPARAADRPGPAGQIGRAHV